MPTFDYNSHDYVTDKPSKFWIIVQIACWFADKSFHLATFPIRLTISLAQLFGRALTGKELGDKYDTFHNN